MAVIWGREMYRSAYAPTDRSSGCFRIVRAYDDLWYVATAQCERIAGPYRRAASARRKAMTLVARYSATMSGVHPALIEMAHAESAAMRRTQPRPYWH